MKTPKRLKKPKPRSHLPPLPDAMRKNFQAQLEALNVSSAAKRTVMQSINAAANPSAESPAVVIESLELEERQIVKQSMPAYSQIFSNVGSRGRNAMMMDMEIDLMIESEADDGQ